MTYTEMKESGVPGGGQIPFEWMVSTFGKIATVKPNLVSPFDYPDFIQISPENITKDSGHLLNYGTVANSGVISWNHLFHKGQIIYSKIRPALNKVAIAPFDGLCSADMYPIETFHNSYFLLYLMRSPYFVEQVSMITGNRVKMPKINQNELSSIRVILPPRKLEESIANFLRNKCSDIDDIIDEAAKSIEEYKNWKTSVIYQAVTKGLNPDIEMKDSGVSWIGKTPVHWHLCRVKNVLINLDELRQPVSAENRENKLGLYDYYGASGIIDRIDDYNVDDTVLLIGEDGANLRMRNLPLVYRACGKFWVNNHAHILKPKANCRYGFAAYALEAGDYNIYITGTAQPKLTQFNLMRFPIVLPPIDEQDEIERYLDCQCSTIESLINEKQSLITDLEAYKKSLIYEAVTGKRKVV